MSWNRPNYKSTSPKTIAEAIKFSNLSPYNSGSPWNHEGFQTKPRATKIVVIQHNTTLVITVHKLLSYIRVWIIYYKTKVKISGSNIISENIWNQILPVQSHILQNHTKRDTTETMPIWSSLHVHMAKTILAATSTNLLPATGGNKPWVREGTQLDLPIKNQK
jgi:hypothetical protein